MSIRGRRRLTAKPRSAIDTATCTLTTTVEKTPGNYSIAVQYFDYWSGKSHFELLVNGRTFGHWVADDTLPPAAPDLHPDGETSTRITFPRCLSEAGRQPYAAWHA